MPTRSSYLLKDVRSDDDSSSELSNWASTRRHGRLRNNIPEKNGNLDRGTRSACDSSTATARPESPDCAQQLVLTWPQPLPPVTEERERECRARWAEDEDEDEDDDEEVEDGVAVGGAGAGPHWRRAAAPAPRAAVRCPRLRPLHEPHLSPLVGQRLITDVLSDDGGYVHISGPSAQGRKTGFFRRHLSSLVPCFRVRTLTAAPGGIRPGVVSCRARVVASTAAAAVAAGTRRVAERCVRAGGVLGASRPPTPTRDACGGGGGAACAQVLIVRPVLIHLAGSGGSGGAPCVALITRCLRPLKDRPSSRGRPHAHLHAPARERPRPRPPPARAENPRPPKNTRHGAGWRADCRRQRAPHEEQRQQRRMRGRRWKRS
ncbi:Protein of unknown function [Gryllus bimaculatus]|nr:Protein of unknown function [Gryllus bimaculatus]